MNEYCYLNGEIVLLKDAKVGVLDIGILRGYGIYEGLAAHNGKVFRFADHWNRLLSGAHLLNLNVPITEEKAEKICEQLLEKNFGKDRANIRIILTGGDTIDGIDYDFEKPTFYIVAEKWTSLPSEFYSDGAKLVTYRHLRELPEYKTTNYIRAVNLQNFRKSENAVEILYTYDGDVLECATSNIFIVKNGTLITPDENILKGITRKVVLELADRNKIPVEARTVLETELKTADEVFITSSFKDIVPIVKVDDYEIGTDKVGDLTKKISEEFDNILEKR